MMLLAWCVTRGFVVCWDYAIVSQKLNKNQIYERIGNMKLPVGTISGEQINIIFEKSIQYHIEAYYKTISEYEPKQLYSNWRSIVRSIDEIINIPFELSNCDEINYFLKLSLNFQKESNLIEIERVKDMLECRFEENVAIRFIQLAMNCHAIDGSYKQHGVFNQFGNALDLSTTQNSISYFQSRRYYYVTTLNLIPKIAAGKKTVPYIETLSYLNYTMDSCLVNITTAYYNLLLNHCLPDFEMYSDGVSANCNFEYDHLEGFFMEPERLSLIDQIELRPEIVSTPKMLTKAVNKIFSYSEVANAMALFEGAFVKYKIKDNIEFKELSSLLYDLSIYLKDDYHIALDEDIFITISSKYTSFELHFNSDDYFENLNSYSPFQKVDGTYYTTVVLLTRFVYRILSQSLLKNKTFQIHSGFVFEDKVIKVLGLKGFKSTGITRINHKEFDIITIKDNKIFNFQCKNNFIDISRVEYNYKKIGRLNKQLCRYYENALIKEKNREHFITSKLGIRDIEHFVISRYPVITRNERIINFSYLEDWQPQ